MTAEHDRLREAREQKLPWRKWGPYLSERQWGTVREDYSANGDAWNYFSHDQSRSRAYRWGEDGIAGISDSKQRLCFALALWNGQDPILKERLFGLTNTEGNHGEDVKEYYFYLDSTPTHSYMKYLYKYPQARYPYEDLIKTNAARGRAGFEYELIDTGIFDEDRYFDVFVEYAKAGPEDMLIEITVHNRGPEAAELQLLPTLWFRNRWSWGTTVERPMLRQITFAPGRIVIGANDRKLGKYYLYCDDGGAAVHGERDQYPAPRRHPQPQRLCEGRHQRLCRPRQGGRGQPGQARHQGLGALSPGAGVRRVEEGAPAPDRGGAGPGARQGRATPFAEGFERHFQARRAEADEFFAAITPKLLSDDQALVMRQALGGMMWGKQFYFYDVDKWLEERGADPYNPSRLPGPRNDQWHHMYNADIISMPDKWEYPWYAAWDLAFHVLALTLVDEDFGKQQLNLMLRERYLHPNGQIPAYEWNFSDVNPPVHAWSTIFTYRLAKARSGKGDLEWLEQAFQKLLLNFTWWVNRKDRAGRNVFEGGFLGMDNIGVFDRSAPLPTGGYLEQADGTAWMALFCLNMLEIAVELAIDEADLCRYGAEVRRAFPLDRLGHEPQGGDTRHVGRGGRLLLRRAAAARRRIHAPQGALHGRAAAALRRRRVRRTSCSRTIPTSWSASAGSSRRGRSWSPPSTIRARRLCRPPAGRDPGRRPSFAACWRGCWTRRNSSAPTASARSPASTPTIPTSFRAGGQEYRVAYVPAESDTGMFGGNSNWRGPIWMPVNALIIRALLQYYGYYGNDFTVECPTGSGRQMNLYQVAEEISRRLGSIFLRDKDGRRPVYGGTAKFQDDPHWRD